MSNQTRMPPTFNPLPLDVRLALEPNSKRLTFQDLLN